MISLPGNDYTNGQAVVYHANGGSVAGLTDGDTYYVIIDSVDPTQISLASSYANATATNPVYIQLSPVTGTDNVLSEIFQTFGASQVDPTGLSIDLPQNVFTTGQAVVYHANGGSVGGLTDGDTYYVIVDPNNTGSSAFIGLASSFANATASPPVPIQLTNVTGTGNYLSEVDVESERAAWTQSQLQNSMSLSIVEPVLFPSTVQAIPDPNLEGKNVAIVVSRQHRHGFGPGYDPAAAFGRAPEARGSRPGRGAARGRHVLQCRPEQHPGPGVPDRSLFRSGRADHQPSEGHQPGKHRCRGRDRRPEHLPRFRPGRCKPGRSCRSRSTW